MHIHIDVDHEDVLTTEPRRLHAIRAAAYFLLHAIGDIKDDDAAQIVPVGTSPAPTPPPPPAANGSPIATAVASNANGAGVPGVASIPSATTNVPPPPPPPPPTDTSGDAGDEDGETGPSNVVNGNFPQAGNVPPPPPGVNTAAPSESAATANTAAAANGVVSAEVDKAGMPYDARIHQKAKGTKKDGTWKLIKGIDENIVKAVTAELAARKGAVAPVSLPAGNTVPVPPVSNGAAAPGVPAPPAGVGAPVPVPPAPAVGSMGASAYRALIDKITDLTRNQKITAAKVMELCQRHGAPNLMQLNSMPDLVPLVDKDVDAAVLGLL